jgi:hypothetical protein
MNAAELLARIDLVRRRPTLLFAILVSCSCSDVEDVATATPSDPREAAYAQLTAIALPGPSEGAEETGSPLPAVLENLQSGERLKLQGSVDLDDLDREYQFAIVEFSRPRVPEGRITTNSGLAELNQEEGRITFEFKTKAPRDPGKHDLVIYLLTVDKHRKTICSGTVEVRGDGSPIGGAP